MWKKAGVSEEKIARLILSLDHETVQGFKDSATAEVLINIRETQPSQIDCSNYYWAEGLRTINLIVLRLSK